MATLPTHRRVRASHPVAFLRAGMLIVGACTLGLAACSESVEEVIEFPVVLRNALPEYQADVVSTFDPRWPEDLTLEFNQVVSHTELRLEFFPPPNQAPLLESSSTRGIVRVKDFDPRPSTVVQSVLVTGTRLGFPYLWSFYAGDRDPTAGILEGWVSIRSTTFKSQFALIYAYRVSSLNGVKDERDVFDVPPDAVGFTVHVSVDASDRSTYWGTLSGLDRSDAYTIAAVLDTNDDGRYDPLEDWWSVSRDPNAISEWFPQWVPPGSAPDTPRIELDLHAPR